MFDYKFYIDYYKDLAENERDYVGEGYKYSFTKNWCISLENFYKEFDELEYLLMGYTYL